MDILTLEDVDKFFDKFEDPSLEVEQICEHFDEVHTSTLPDVVSLGVLSERIALYEYFMKKLIMKSYRLGKEHAYADSIATIRDR